jgi:hypothetical protein
MIKYGDEKRFDKKIIFRDFVTKTKCKIFTQFSIVKKHHQKNFNSFKSYKNANKKVF